MFTTRDYQIEQRVEAYVDGLMRPKRQEHHEYDTWLRRHQELTAELAHELKGARVSMNSTIMLSLPFVGFAAKLSEYVSGMPCFTGGRAEDGNLHASTNIPLWPVKRYVVKVTNKEELRTSLRIAYRPIEDRRRYAVVSNVEIRDGDMVMPPCCILVGVRAIRNDKLLTWNKVDKEVKRRWGFSLAARFRALLPSWCGGVELEEPKALKELLEPTTVDGVMKAVEQAFEDENKKLRDQALDLEDENKKLRDQVASQLDKMEAFEDENKKLRDQVASQSQRLDKMEASQKAAQVAGPGPPLAIAARVLSSTLTVPIAEATGDHVLPYCEDEWAEDSAAAEDQSALGGFVSAASNDKRCLEAVDDSEPSPLAPQADLDVGNAELTFVTGPWLSITRDVGKVQQMIFNWVLLVLILGMLFNFIDLSGALKWLAVTSIWGTFAQASIALAGIPDLEELTEETGDFRALAQ